ncbi:MAG: c-type cytochrome [Elusimicrobia bacterium]|nr:c-type cytochrome [Elusimicrobiota bacterium]
MLRKLFVGGNVALVLWFAVALYQDYQREWKRYPAAYNRLQAQEAPAPKARQTIRNRPLEIKQLMLAEFHRVDRCITCHQGMDSLTTPSLANAFQEQPFKAHPNPLQHPFETFGCTVCHGGQGLATTVKTAHGEIPHWEEPLLRGPLIQASCGKCHAQVESLKGAGVLAKGRQLFKENGCIGCHQIHGDGGPISVDLAEETAVKPLARIDFSYTGLPKSQRTLAHWIKLHLTKSPAELVPGDPKGEFGDPIAPSGMPAFNFSEEEATALTTFVLSLADKDIPQRYRVPAPQPAAPRFASSIEHGKYVFQKYGCIGCHGKDGAQGRSNFNAQGGFIPTLGKTVGTYSRDELRRKIREGVPVVARENPNGPPPPLYMPIWKDKIKGQELEALLDYLMSIAQKTEEWTF